MQCSQLPVDIAGADVIAVRQRKPSDTRSAEHFSQGAPYSAQSDHEYAGAPQAVDGFFAQQLHGSLLPVLRGRFNM